MRRLLIALALGALLGFATCGEVYTEFYLETPLQTASYTTIHAKLGMLEEFWYENIWTDMYIAVDGYAAQGFLAYNWSAYVGMHLGDRKNFIKFGFLYDDMTGWWFKAGFHVAFNLPFKAIIKPVEFGKE